MFMRKILCCLLILAASAAFGDGLPAHVMIGSVSRCTGGNDSVYVQEQEYINGPDENRDIYPSITVLAREWSDVPASKDTVPTRQRGLMNPGEPVEITAFGDTVYINEWGGSDIYAMRVFDGEGAFIAGDSVLNQTHNPIALKLSSEPQNFYIEFAQAQVNYDDDPLNPTLDPNTSPQYCYVLLSMTAGRPISGDFD